MGVFRRTRARLRTFSIKDLLAKPIVREVWIVERSDGSVWAGPYKWNGTTFTKVPHYFYYFGTKESAEAAVTGCDLRHTIRFYGSDLQVRQIK